MPIIRKITISCDTFWGFSRFVDIETLNSEFELVNKLLDLLNDFLVSENLQALIDKLKDRRKFSNGYHIHNISFENIKLLPENETIYVCYHN